MKGTIVGVIKLFLVSFLIIVCIVLCYAVIPTILIRVSGRGITKNIQRKGIALTFDDGPHPEYTPQLLDLLQKYGIKASFFVVGSKVKRNSEIIKRMHRGGSYDWNSSLQPYFKLDSLAHSLAKTANDDRKGYS